MSPIKLLIVVCTLFHFRTAADQTNFTGLFPFGGTEGKPQTGVIEGSNRKLYGVTFKGGTNREGVLFSLNKDGTDYQVLRSFSESSIPYYEETDYTTLQEAPNGYLFGSSRRIGLFRVKLDGSQFSTLIHPPVNPTVVFTEDGRVIGSLETNIFAIRADGSEFRLFTNVFPVIDPHFGLLKGVDGYLYGARSVSRASGVVFKIRPNGQDYSELKEFGWGTGLDAGFCRQIILGTDNYIYGSVVAGGENPAGFIYKIGLDGSNYTVLHRFSGWVRRWQIGFSTNSTKDGAIPWGQLLEGTDGYLYGSTQYGGKFSGGTIFRISKSGLDYRILYDFTSGSNDGGQPQSRLIEASDGKLYGSTSLGGNQGEGVIYSINKDGSEFSIIKRFIYNGQRGSGPVGDLLLARNGFIYGTTSRGGSNEYGTIYRVNKDGSGHTILKSFAFSRDDGGVPLAGVIEGHRGYLYGTTAFGGAFQLGTVFQIKTDGTDFKILHHFRGGTNDGARPHRKLLYASDGALYGVTRTGGRLGGGVYFKYPFNGNYTVLHHLSEYQTIFGSELNETPERKLYGIQYSAWHVSEGLGFLFRISGVPHSYSNVLEFPIEHNDRFAWQPRQAPSIATNGHLLGAADGIYTLDTFTGATTVFSNAQGAFSLSVDNDGSYYALIRPFAETSVFVGKGTQTDSPVTLLHEFTSQSIFGWPYSKLLIANNGSLFGTAGSGGPENAGAIFRLSAGPFPPITVLGATSLESITTLHVLGQPGQTFRVQASDNLERPIWHLIAAAVIGDNGAAEVVDVQSTNYMARFYRAVQP